MSQVVVYSTDPCAYCARAKMLLRAKGIVFDEVNLARDPDGRIELAHRTGMMTFPQILIDGELIGGYTELQAAAASGRLDGLTDAANPDPLPAA